MAKQLTQYPYLEVGDLWMDENGTVRQVFSIWRGEVCYGFVKSGSNEFGSDCCSTYKFITRYADKYIKDAGTIDDYLIDKATSIIEDLKSSCKTKGQKPPKMSVGRDIPQFL